MARWPYGTEPPDYACNRRLNRHRAALQDPDQRVIICRAADTASQAAMDAVAREAERPRLQVL
jgi:hypothetical protein